MYSNTIEQLIYSSPISERSKLIKKKKLLTSKIKRSDDIQKISWKEHAKSAAKIGYERGKKYGPLVGTVAGGTIGALNPIRIPGGASVVVNPHDYIHHSDFRNAVLDASRAESRLGNPLPLGTAALGATLGGMIGKHAGGAIGQGIGYAYGSTRNKRNKLMNKIRKARLSRINKRLGNYAK